MSPTEPEAPEELPAPTGAVSAGAVLVFIGGVVQVGCGVAALAGLDVLQRNVREIESHATTSHLYLSLTGWGVLLLLAGFFELFSARALVLRRAHGRLLALAATLPALALAFFTLVLFRGVAIISVLILISALYVLSYRTKDGTERSDGY